uniref:Deoxyribonuclease-1-like 1 n=1 Tax=Ursus maritimus TaxID=29073 RepID=A0A452V047_URSMA
MHCPAVLLLLLPGGAEAFRICAFNAQRLTLSKAAREHVMDTFVRILARCDIMVLQEVVDSSGSAISLLLRELNRFDGSGSYSFLSSPSLGRSTYMEKYVYIYRSHKTQVLDSYMYEDKDDLFAREPFVAQFTFPSKVLPSLVLVPLHTTPKAVEQELNALYDVFLDVSQRWQTKDMILLGDFNADCASLTKKRLGPQHQRPLPCGSRAEPGGTQGPASLPGCSVAGAATPAAPAGPAGLNQPGACCPQT